MSHSATAAAMAYTPSRVGALRSGYYAGTDSAPRKRGPPGRQRSASGLINQEWVKFNQEGGDPIPVAARRRPPRVLQHRIGVSSGSGRMGGMQPDAGWGAGEWDGGEMSVEVRSERSGQ